MSSIKTQLLKDIAEELERLSGTIPTIGLRLEVSDEARLRRVRDALRAIDALGGGGGGSAPTALPDLTDVADALAPAAGQVLTFNGSEWDASMPATPALALDDLTDVSSPSPASGEVLTWNGSAWAPATPATPTGPTLIKHLTVELPENGDDITFFYNQADITISEIQVVLIGSSSPSITWTLKHATDRSAAGTTIKSATTTATTTGDTITTFSDATIPADSWVWLEVSADSGIVDEIGITLLYTED